MRKYFLFIMFMIWMCFLAGCRAKLESSRQESQRHVDEIGVVLHRLDSLGSTIAERQHIKVEFYPLLSEYSGWPIPTTDTAAKIGPSGRTARFGDGGGVGAVKSIEIVTERDVTSTATSAVDSTSVFKTEQESASQKETATEHRNDNGTWFILAVVAAVAFIVLVLIIIRKFFKK